jgi:hypothetical protein
VAKREELSRQDFSVAYDGEALKEGYSHSVDVQTLAPALLAFGKLIREANTEFNGKKATAKVLVVSDFEHKCFNINFEVVIGLFEQVKTLLGSEPVKSAKEVLEWLGLLGLPVGEHLPSFLQFLKWRNGRKIEAVTPLTDADKTGIVEVRVDGDHNSIQVHTTSIS